MSLHICAGIVTGHWLVYTFAQADLAFVTVPKSRVLPQMAIFVLFTPGRRLVSLHICAGVVTGQCKKY